MIYFIFDLYLTVPLRLDTREREDYAFGSRIRAF